ncbi:MAG TPA: hypothetical protein VEU47_17570 [Candidatus Cybelea sp.]|nr:hypothetical protein [Candidatus Cybelea sp.]
MTDVKTVFGSLRSYQKGGIEIINDDPKNYVFSNVFEVADKSKPYERVAVGKNFEYVIEALRADGTSPWYACDHDEFALVMDGQVEIRLVKPAKTLVPAGKAGAVKVQGAPEGKKMGRIVAARGHMALLPKGSAYQFHADRPSVVTIQTIQGDVTIERWAQICQTR